jgi:hypothetical protein
MGQTRCFLDVKPVEFWALYEAVYKTGGQDDKPPLTKAKVLDMERRAKAKWKSKNS